MSVVSATLIPPPVQGSYSSSRRCGAGNPPRPTSKTQPDQSAGRNAHDQPHDNRLDSAAVLSGEASFCAASRDASTSATAIRRKVPIGLSSPAPSEQSEPITLTPMGRPDSVAQR